jgi:hypothetical protein
MVGTGNHSMAKGGAGTHERGTQCRADTSKNPA